MTKRSAHGCDLLIKGGTVVTDRETLIANVAIRDGVIVGVSTDTPAADRAIDAAGLLVLPGGVDPHTHLNSEWPFQDQRKPADDFDSGTRAAAAGGITTICDFVYPIGEESLIQAIDRVIEDATTKAHVDFALHVAITTFREEFLAELPDVLQVGCPSFKFFTPEPDFQSRPADYLRFMSQAAPLGGLAMFHCEDPAILEYCRSRLVRSGHTAPRYYPAAKPIEVEIAATALAVTFAATAGIPAYIVHLSCGSALDQVLSARTRGARVFVETRPLYLHLTSERFDAEDEVAARYIGTPPLRTEADRTRLWSALASGEIDAVGSDHVGFTRAQKHHPGDTFETVPRGVASMETMLPLLYSEGVRGGRITLQRFVDLVSTRPAKIFGMYPRKGAIAVGSDADLCVLDPTRKRTVSSRAMHSAADFDLFDGVEVVGWPIYTVSRGEVVYADGEVVARRGRGCLVRRRPVRLSYGSH
jgi:dihydropyrimidinase